MEALFLIGGFAFAAWRLWVAIDRAEHPTGRSYPQRRTAPGALVAPGRDHPCYAPGEWEREQSEWGIGRESGQSIYARLRQQEEENEARLAVLLQGESGDAWQRDPDPVAVPAGHHRQAAPIQQAAPKAGYTIPKHDPAAWARESNTKGKEAENAYCREHGLPEVWQ